MPWRNKIIWSEGLFIRPQHFQQQDRYIEYLVDSRCSSLHAFDWGITVLEIDHELLSLGKFAIVHCKGIMPDGTVFNIPEDAPVPAPLSVPIDLHNELLYLTLPIRRQGSTETEVKDSNGSMARYQSMEVDVDDNNAGQHQCATVQVGQLRLRLMLESEDRSRFNHLRIARVIETRKDKGILLDNSFIPTCLHCSANAELVGYLTELLGLLAARSGELAGRVTEAGRGGVAEFSDFLMLQLLNKYLPLMRHLASIPALHPQTFYQNIIQIAGELATFTSKTKLTPEFSIYHHNNLESSFVSVMQELRRSLSIASTPMAIAVTMAEPQYGVRVARIEDSALIQQAQFVLAVKAELRQEVLQNQFPSQVKIAPVENIRQMISSALPGIEIRLLPVAPRQIPFHAGFTYFELDRNSHYWDKLSQSNAFAIHLSGDFPGLELEFWAIRG
ncbi:MAG: type VI secretion system baseplate subunit TssK [Thiohalomonadales bacterium]